MGERKDRITLDDEWPFWGGSRQRIDGRVFDDGVVCGWKNGVVLIAPISWERKKKHPTATTRTYNLVQNNGCRENYGLPH